MLTFPLGQLCNLLVKGHIRFLEACAHGRRWPPRPCSSCAASLTLVPGPALALPGGHHGTLDAVLYRDWEPVDTVQGRCAHAWGGQAPILGEGGADAG